VEKLREVFRSELKKFEQEIIVEAMEQGAAEERARIRLEVESLLHTCEDNNPIDKAIKFAFNKVLNLLQPNTNTQPEIMTFDEDTPSLNELENGPWQKFVKQIKENKPEILVFDDPNEGCIE